MNVEKEGDGVDWGSGVWWVVTDANRWREMRIPRAAFGRADVLVGR